jgi:hypothetical protein
MPVSIPARAWGSLLRGARFAEVVSSRHVVRQTHVRARSEVRIGDPALRLSHLTKPLLNKTNNFFVICILMIL